MIALLIQGCGSFNQNSALLGLNVMCCFHVKFHISIGSFLLNSAVSLCYLQHTPICGREMCPGNSLGSGGMQVCARKLFTESRFFFAFLVNS